jgi:S-formylglutathione hydrolase FrmB
MRWIIVTGAAGAWRCCIVWAPQWEDGRRVLDYSVVSGPVPVVVLVAGLVALAGLTARRGRAWWLRVVPLAAVVGGVCAAVVAVVVDVLWRPFPDPLPWVTLLWTGLVVAALALAVARFRVAPQARSIVCRTLPCAAAALVVVTGLSEVNQLYYAYPTLRSALGLAPTQQIAIGDVAPRQPQVATAPPGAPLASVWTAPADMPSRGAVSEVPVPGTVSGFTARPAWVYFPPAYLSSPRALLPVLVLVPGQPGAPRDWLDGGRLVQTMDAFAAAHSGLAPVVVVADPLGSQLAQTLCVDSPRGQAFTYLTVDVPAWIRSTLQVDPDTARWAIGGLSAGGTCALQLAVNAPSVYPTFLDLSGPEAPTVGSVRRTVNDFFGGSNAAYRQVNPLDVLASGRVPAGALAGAVVVGSGDSRYGPDARRVRDALLAAGMDARYLELPGGHSWQVWAEALRRLLPFVGARGGLVAG